MLLDRTGRLTETWLPSQLEASFDEQREWAFLFWLNLGDAAKHGRRGNVWRAAHSLEQARDYGWKLYAASFESVSVETANLPSPPGIEGVLVVLALEADAEPVLAFGRELHPFLIAGQRPMLRREGLIATIA
ncbi:hypothetical protein [Amycolatopsis sp. NPDC051071]|uniref:hypothetical protein n=1 Tax=Amycolatopsis sp. NPDC051071 TaxID=3154637 RepID=UPI00344A2AB7